VSILTFLYWGLLIPGGDLENALIRAITVLIISCPCALGLATPAAIVVAMGASARMNVLFKNAETLEIFGRLRVVALDKTGTLTRGSLHLSGIYPAPGVGSQELLGYCARAELNNNHPLARSLVESARRENLTVLPPAEARDLPGEGVMAKVEEGWIYAGSLSFIEGKVRGKLPPLPEEEGIYVAVALNDRFLGYLRLSDELRASAYEFVSGLKALGITPVLISGDREKPVREVADKLGIPIFFSGLKPKEKLAKLEELRKKYGMVGMIGDGINDAPALKSADVGIALMSGSDLTKEAGDVIVLENDLLTILKALKLSRHTLKIIYQNLGMSFFYNIIAIPVAAGVLAPFAILLKPWMGAVGMALSDLAVIGNSLRLRDFPSEKGETSPPLPSPLTAS
jgi:Cu+-exporting ATPase